MERYFRENWLAIAIYKQLLYLMRRDELEEARTRERLARAANTFRAPGKDDAGDRLRSEFRAVFR
jgi:hypothetical protein